MFNKIILNKKTKLGDDNAEFQNAGYMGLYGGLTVNDIHKKKNLRENEKLIKLIIQLERL